MPAAGQELNNIEKEGVLKEGERSPEEKTGIMEGLLGEDCKQRHKLPEAK